MRWHGDYERESDSRRPTEKATMSLQSLYRMLSIFYLVSNSQMRIGDEIGSPVVVVLFFFLPGVKCAQGDDGKCHEERYSLPSVGRR